MQRFRQRSAETYARHAWERDVPYGEALRERFDWYAQADAGAPTLLFIHGGYWQASDKDDYAFVAEGLIEAGFNVGLLEYTLAPDASMGTIVGQIGKALDYLLTHREALNNIGQQVVLCGHSAGGHLTALYRQHPLVTLAMPISGLMELRPHQPLLAERQAAPERRRHPALQPPAADRRWRAVIADRGRR